MNTRKAADQRSTDESENADLVSERERWRREIRLRLWAAAFAQPLARRRPGPTRDDGRHPA